MCLILLGCFIYIALFSKHKEEDFDRLIPFPPVGPEKPRADTMKDNGELKKFPKPITEDNKNFDNKDFIL